MKEFILSTENDLLRLAAQLARLLQPGLILFLNGPLGAGKTTFTRGILNGLGYEGNVKSPTYTIVEPYEVNFPFYHFDLYRINDPEELAFMGIKDYMSGDSICVFEWPEKGMGMLPTPDLICTIVIQESGRKITFNADTLSGKQIMEKLV